MEQQQQPSNVHGIKLAEIDSLKDDKYVVIKRTELDQFLLELGCTAVHDHMEPAHWAYDVVSSFLVPDAVVIRTQDVFAGPALNSYAHSIALVAKLTDNWGTAVRLRKAADYFADRAREADVQAYEETAKLPD
jgi:hypothetical protein